MSETAGAKPKVMVGMSGGVDSSVAALLLAEQGYEVVGVTLKLWDADGEDAESGPAAKGCCSLRDVEDARAVCWKIGIPHYVLNFKDVFRRDVVDPFAAEYRGGRTPNPCIACNRRIKMGAMLDRAAAMGFDFIATGHYARILYNGQIGRYELLKGLAGKKDQSYVLYHLTQDRLAHTLLPLGGMTKEAVRAVAAERGLLTARKPDSQEICFIPDNDHAAFLRRYDGADAGPGDFVDREGKAIGRHEGIARYTIGQRKGLGTAFGIPMFVTGIDPAANTVALGPEEELFRRGMIVDDLNFIRIPELTSPVRASVRIRYNAAESPAVLAPLADGRVEVTFDEPLRAITPGQAAVFYLGDSVLGGGTIRRSF